MGTYVVGAILAAALCAAARHVYRSVLSGKPDCCGGECGGCCSCGCTDSSPSTGNK